MRRTESREVRRIELEQERELILAELAELERMAEEELQRARLELLHSRDELPGEKGYKEALQEMDGLVDEREDLNQKLRDWQNLYEDGKYDEYFKAEDSGKIGEIHKKLNRIQELDSFITGHPIEKKRDQEDEAIGKRCEKKERLRKKLEQIDKELKDLFKNELPN